MYNFTKSMTRVVQIFLTVTLFLLASCTSSFVLPSNVEAPSQKLPVKVALILTKQDSRVTHRTEVKAKCGDFEYHSNNKGEITYKRPITKANGVIRAANSVWSDNMLANGLSYFFEKVDVYNSIDAIKNRDEYDFILSLQVRISTDYDKVQALERNISFDTKSYYGSVEGTHFGVNAFARFDLRIVRADNDELVKIIEGTAYSEGTTAAVHCSKDIFDYDFFLIRSYGEQISSAMNYALGNLLKAVGADMSPLARIKFEEKSLPSDLAVTANFSDNGGFMPNRNLDAGEDAEIVVTVRNTGKGVGFKTKLEVSSDNPKIAIDKQIDIGDIQVGESKEIKIGIRSGLDLQAGKATIQVALMEKRGYDAKKVVLNIPTAKLEKPQLEIAPAEINDGETGLAKGNGNGIPENGETVELTVYVKNQGEGKAIGVNLNGGKISSGIKWVRDSVHIGTIQPGDVAKAKVAFTVPRNFDAREIAAHLRVSDMRGVNEVEKKAVLAYVKRSPDIKYAWRTLFRGTQVDTLVNGEVYELDITFNNRGEIPAKDVSVSIFSDGKMVLSEKNINLGEIKTGESVSKRVTVSVPRTFEEKLAQLSINVSQSDFPSIKDTIQYAVDVKKPRLTYLANLQSRSGGNTLEQGESSVFEVQVLNEGNLPAKGVKVIVKSKDENLKLVGQTDSLIGIISANSRSETIKIPVSTLRRIKTGDVFLDVNITQDDFVPVASQYAINIMEEGAVVVDVESESRERSRPVAKVQSGPVINLKGSQNELTTSDETYSLTFEAEDPRNVEKIIVAVNGRVILNDTPGLKRKEILKEIPLNEGENRVAIAAYNADNISSRKEFVITRQVEEDVDTPPITGNREPDAVAVVIGISRYENKDIPRVDYARRDAATVKEYLIRTLGFDAKNIIELYDEEATLSRLNSVFRTKLKNVVAPGKSDVFVFFSGHGVPDVNKKEPYLAPYGLDPADIDNTGFILKDLYEQLAKIDAKSITVAIDSCFSGSSERGAIIKDISPVFLDVANPMLKVKNGVIFTASSSKQVSSWYHKKQHGLFTYFFLNGLRGKADKDNDGLVTVKELEEYIKRNVRDQARQLNREQTPEVTGATDKVLVRYK